MFPYRGRGFVNNAVLRRASVLERKIEAKKVEANPDHFRLEDAQRLLQQLLAGLISFENDECLHIADRTANDPREEKQ